MLLKRPLHLNIGCNFYVQLRIQYFNQNIINAPTNIISSLNGKSNFSVKSFRATYLQDSE